MDVDADNHGEEGIALFGMYTHIMQMIIVEYPVIYPFAGSAVIVNLLIFIRPSWHRGIEPDVPIRLGVDTAAIRRRGTFLLTGTGFHLAAGKRTPPFTGMLLLTIAPVDHAEPGHAQRGAVFVNGDGIGNGAGPAAVIVEVNERPDIPILAKPIGGIVVMCGVQAEIAYSDIRIDGLKFTEGDDGADTVVPPGVKETDMQWEVNSNIGIV